MSYVPRLDIDITVGISLDAVVWPASAVRYDYDNNRSYMNLRGRALAGR
jgi:hypothetical protein